jgi:hypothetical protein
MRHAPKISLLFVLGVLAAFAACGDDGAVVREGADGGSAAAADAQAATLSCGVVVPASYESAGFAVNAREELDLKRRFGELEDRMKAAEGAGTAVVTAAELRATLAAGTPSLRSVATPAAQARVDEYLTQFGDLAVAGGTTWTPADALAEGGAPRGGKYEGANLFSATGVDLREGVAKVLLGGALYNHALSLTTGPLTEATIDRLLAVFGATIRLANRTDPDAGPDERDELIAEYAARRDRKTGAPLGPYRKIKAALLGARAAAAAGERCRADLDAALAVYFLEWERASYLTAIFYLNAAATNASATPPKGAAALHGFGEAAGLIEGFRGLPQDRRKVTDAQIDKLLETIGGATPYRLITNTPERLAAFNDAFLQIGAIYGLSPSEIEEAKRSY